jgi:hypothetical protein
MKKKEENWREKEKRREKDGETIEILREGERRERYIYRLHL